MCLGRQSGNGLCLLATSPWERTASSTGRDGQTGRVNACSKSYFDFLEKRVLSSSRKIERGRCLRISRSKAAWASEFVASTERGWQTESERHEGIELQKRLIVHKMTRLLHEKSKLIQLNVKKVVDEKNEKPTNSAIDARG
jgi:hypothetical protein